MNISKKALQLIKGDSDLRAKLMLVDGKSESTIARWLRIKSNQLTMPSYTKVISDHTGLSVSEILVAQKQHELL